MVKRQWHINLFNMQPRKVCFCWKIYYDFKNKIYKHMTAVSKMFILFILEDVVDKYNNTYHTTIEIKPIDVKSGLLILMLKIQNLKCYIFKV